MKISTVYYFDYLSFELITKILCNDELPLKTFGNCQKVCKLFNKIVNAAKTIWEKWANIVDKDNQWKPIYISKSLKDDFIWKHLIIDFKNTEKQTLKFLSDKTKHLILRKTLDKTQYHELTPFLHSDNPETLNLLGESFLFERGCVKNMQKALKYFKQAATLRHAGGQYNLGHCYEQGIGCSKSLTMNKAFPCYQLAADQGHKEAQYSVGVYYEIGVGCQQKDMAKAFHYYQLAADQGHKDAQYNVGVCYAKGVGCQQKNITKAFHYYQLAADQGHKDAQYNLGDYYVAGVSCQQNMAKAFHYYQLAADQGHKKAQYSVRDYQAAGVSCQRSLHDPVKEKNRQQINNKMERQTVKWLSFKVNHSVLKKTLEKTQYHELSPFLNSKNPDILALLGESLAYGKGCGRNEEQALEYFKQAAHKKQAHAQYHLGLYYEAEADDVENPSTQAFHYFKLAADQGHADAQNSLSDFYEKGISCPQDSVQAFHYLKLAADQKNADALFRLGVFYVVGIQCQKDLVKGFHYIEWAADQGLDLAQDCLGKLYETGTGCQQNWAKAFHYRQLAADQGNAQAQYNLGICYEKGLGCSQDRDKAFEFFKLAAAQGHSEAISKLINWSIYDSYNSQ